MARKPSCKELKNTRLLKEYASWIYCESCNKTVAYLCYVTYDSFDFTYTCGCGGSGYVHIEFERENDVSKSTEPLIDIKNRLCCPEDKSPLVTFVEKNLKTCNCSVVCKECGVEYTAIKTEED